MSDPIVIPPGGGEVVGDSPERRVEILSDHDALHAIWSRFDPRREGADLHTPSRGFGAYLRALDDTGDEKLAAARAGFDQQPAAARAAAWRGERRT
jgi:hypothetical protein